MDRYEITEEMGFDSFATVDRATDLMTGGTVVLKKIALGPGLEIPLGALREASILYDLHHPNITRLERVFVHDEYLILVLECASMDLLLHRCWMDNHYPKVVREFLKQILCGICYCHSQGVIHRDLKPANILVDSKTVPATLKIADFGWARAFLQTDGPVTPKAVTLAYRAPLVLSTIQPRWTCGL